jgi:GH15 family glucan-1,4-alpha-glucosidase
MGSARESRKKGMRRGGVAQPTSKRPMLNLADHAQPAIKDYAIIGDCRTAALISRQGSLDWLCLPDFSAPSVFARLLDKEGGHFSIKPRSSFSVKRRYLHATAVLETIFETESGSARIMDLCPIVDSVGSLGPMREVLRIVEGLEGSIDLEIEIAPRPGFGRARAALGRLNEAVWRCSWANELLLLNSSVRLVRNKAALQGTICTAPGKREHMSLSYVKDDIGTIAPIGSAADARCERSLAWWRSWCSVCKFDGPEREAVLRSAITLKLLTFCLSGAIVAAPTTSLPEAIGGARNWDYRYCWLRDAGLTMTALVELGFYEEASAYLGWLLHATRLARPNLSILYDVYGRTNLRECILNWFEGYLRSRPVRVGNNAVTQFQLDVHGQVIAAAQAYAASGCRLGPTEAAMLARLGDVVSRRWREPDNGIWEIPGARRQYTSSKVMCWVALDKLLSLHNEGKINVGSRKDLFRRMRADIAECIEARGFNSDLESYTGELDGSEVDAALLFMVCFGYKDARDPRMVSTYERIMKDLGCKGLLYRYRPGYDGLKEKEGAFGICSFFAVTHLAERGLIEEAEPRFDHLCSLGNDVGLFAEQTEPCSGAALGNYPQAFTHVGLIYAALSIERARRRACQ